MLSGWGLVPRVSWEDSCRCGVEVEGRGSCAVTARLPTCQRSYATIEDLDPMWIGVLKKPWIWSCRGGVLKKPWIWSCRRHVQGRAAALGKLAGCRYQIRRCDSTPEDRHLSPRSSIMSSCSALETCISKIWDAWHVVCDGMQLCAQACSSLPTCSFANKNKLSPYNYTCSLFQCKAIHVPLQIKTSYPLNYSFLTN
jgi:hypothetical protein